MPLEEYKGRRSNYCLNRGFGLRDMLPFFFFFNGEGVADGDILNRDVHGERFGPQQAPSSGGFDQPWKRVKYLDRSHSADILVSLRRVTCSLIHSTNIYLFIYLSIF